MGCEEDLCGDSERGIRGPRGYKGDKGDKGEPGQNGSVGPSGPAGPAGPAGTKGDTGATGPIGPQGIQGVPGPPGAPGSTGAPGQDGDIGPAGAAGKDGLNGDPGENGNYVSAVADPTLAPNGGIIVSQYSGKDNSKMADFTILNGANGKSGRGVAVFVQPNPPVDNDVTAQYGAVPGFGIDYINVSGTYEANKLRPGDLWIKP